MSSTATEHGYNRYAAGCRCETCKSAKAAYMRRHRARAKQRRVQTGSNVVDGIQHGISGYQDSSCRCKVCRRAAKAHRVQRQRRLAYAAALAAIADDVRTVLAQPTTHNHALWAGDTGLGCQQCAARKRLAAIFTDQDGAS